MIRKVFLLGRPGSGKSTVARFFQAIAQKNGWDVLHLYDYQLLQRWFQREQDKNIPEEQCMFSPKGPETCHGFDVRKGKFYILDTVLKEMAEEVRAEVQRRSASDKLILIEFARQEYSKALYLFGQDILREAHLLYVELGLDTCIERVHFRAAENRARSEYDHFVSDEIMRDYYKEDDWSSEEFTQYHDCLLSDGVRVSTEVLWNSGNCLELKGTVEALFDLIREVDLTSSLPRVASIAR